MMNKYHGQVQDIDESIQLGIRQKKPKTRLLGELRKKKIILHAMAKCQKQIDTVRSLKELESQNEFVKKNRDKGSGLSSFINAQSYIFIMDIHWPR